MDKITREMLHPKAEKDFLAKEGENEFNKRKEKLMKGAEEIVGADNIMHAHDLVIEAEKLLEKYGIASNIPRSEYEKVSQEMGYEDAMVAAICEKAEHRLAQTELKQ